MTGQVLAFLPNLIGIFGAWALGAKRRGGNLILVVSEVAWAVLAVYTHLWTLLAWAVIWAAVWARSYRRWAA